MIVSGYKIEWNMFLPVLCADFSVGGWLDGEVAVKEITAV